MYQNNKEPNLSGQSGHLPDVVGPDWSSWSPCCYTIIMDEHYKIIVVVARELWL